VVNIIKIVTAKIVITIITRMQTVIAVHKMKIVYQIIASRLARQQGISFVLLPSRGRG